MLDTHQNRPHVRSPIDLCTYFFDSFQNLFIYLFMIFLNFFHSWPLIMRLIKVIPLHLVNPDSQHRFEFWIDALKYDSSLEQFVDVEGGCMPIIEDKRVPQWFWLEIKCFWLTNKLKQSLIDFVCSEVILLDCLLCRSIDRFFQCIS